jgi:hypothetical protein
MPLCYVARTKAYFPDIENKKSTGKNESGSYHTRYEKHFIKHFYKIPHCLDVKFHKDFYKHRSLRTIVKVLKELPAVLACQSTKFCVTHSTGSFTPHVFL